MRSANRSRVRATTSRKTSRGRGVANRGPRRAHAVQRAVATALLEAVAMLSESERLVQKLWGNVDYLNKVR